MEQLFKPYLEQISAAERVKILTNIKSPAVLLARIKMLIQKGKIKPVSSPQVASGLRAGRGLEQ